MRMYWPTDIQVHIDRYWFCGPEKLLAVSRKIEKSCKSKEFPTLIADSCSQNGSKVKFLFDFSFEKLDFAFRACRRKSFHPPDQTGISRSQNASSQCSAQLKWGATFLVSQLIYQISEIRFGCSVWVGRTGLQIAEWPGRNNGHNNFNYLSVSRYTDSPKPWKCINKSGCQFANCCGLAF